MIHHGHTAESLCDFTERVRRAFLERRILSPVHLCSDTQAQPLLDAFREVEPHDWVCSNWRSSFHALLKGIPEEELFSAILAGKSMFIMSMEHRFLASSIVGGMLPIACGLAIGIKRAGGGERVHVFVGDMTARTGLFHEFVQYCDGHELPVRVVVEDNGMSTNTPTARAWGSTVEWLADNVPVTHYRYERTEAHVGVGERVEF